MKYLWRRLTGRCTCCGQRLSAEQTIRERMSEINDKAMRLADSLGRWPKIQSCAKCHRMVFEGQSGFGQSLLLIDMQ